MREGAGSRTLDTLERRIAALTAQREAVRARQRKQERADDLRRKVLVGALVLARWPEGRVPEEWRRALDGYLTRPHDRRLFSLTESPEPDERHEAPG
jgi:hypothetical protein